MLGILEMVAQYSCSAKSWSASIAGNVYWVDTSIGAKILSFDMRVQIQRYINDPLCKESTDKQRRTKGHY